MPASRPLALKGSDSTVSSASLSSSAGAAVVPELAAETRLPYTAEGHARVLGRHSVTVGADRARDELTPLGREAPGLNDRSSVNKPTPRIRSEKS